jgi:hypothetical protein
VGARSLSINRDDTRPARGSFRETRLSAFAMTATRQREQLPNRRRAETFELKVAGLRYTATVGRFADGRIGEIFLNNHKSNSAADTAARDSAIVFSIAVQCGADPETIRKALCRDSQGRASGPLGAVLDQLAGSPR